MKKLLFILLLLSFLLPACSYKSSPAVRRVKKTEYRSNVKVYGVSCHNEKNKFKISKNKMYKTSKNGGKTLGSFR